MQAIKGPAVFLAQFASDEAPYNRLEGLAGWAAAKGFVGVQLPCWDTRLIDIEKAADRATYVDEIRGLLADHGLVVTELATHLQGQLVASHPAFDHPADSFAAPAVRKNPKARQEWAVRQMRAAAKASRRFGLDRHVTFPGTLLWPYLYPYPQWPDGLIDEGFDEHRRFPKPLISNKQVLT